eukprot:TRINITY_DN9432_c0_g1_i2.p1 TRINITY_DN9432_c0_g1~~TRINITY_DN9432_c0_g1_i2.p1  ORF type:complete len:177 (-),score=42.14 TRINITY_DN9432_c0_g1_i2:549-1079(-)
MNTVQRYLILLLVVSCVLVCLVPPCISEDGAAAASAAEEDRNEDVVADNAGQKETKKKPHRFLDIPKHETQEDLKANLEASKRVMRLFFCVLFVALSVCGFIVYYGLTRNRTSRGSIVNNQSNRSDELSRDEMLQMLVSRSSSAPRRRATSNSTPSPATTSSQQTEIAAPPSDLPF